MIIKFYKNFSPDEAVSKSLADEINFECTLKRQEGVSVTTPIVEIAGEYDEIVGYNYAYIPDFHRFYYITDVNFYRTGYYTITLKCDVLMSFWDEFKGNVAIVSRNQTHWNQFFEDKRKISQADEYFDRYVYDVPEFSGSSLLLVASASGVGFSGDIEEG